MTEIFNKNNSIFYIRIILAIICSIFVFLLIYNDFNLYKEPIGKIIDVKNNKNKQELSLEIKNGKQKGKNINITNKYDPSFVYDEKYHKGDIVFLNSNLKNIQGVKRDHIIAGTLLLLLCFLVAFGGTQGLLTIVCLIGNIGLFALLIKMYMSGKDIILITVAAAILFAFLVLLLINGFNKRLSIAFAATILTTVAICLIAVPLIHFTHIDYDFLRFLPGPYDNQHANRFFLAQIMIGSLGAVIDVSVTVTAASTELVNKTKKIKLKDLISSVKIIADDITGTMINVVLLTNIAALIPVFMISMPNDIGFTTVLRYDAYFDITRILMGIVGILISIPISIVVASIFFNQEAVSD